MTYVCRMNESAKTRRGSYASVPEQAALSVKDAAAADVGSMVRTQVYLTRSQHDFLSSEAQRQNQPMAAVLRSLIEERMAIPDTAWDHNSLLDPPADETFIGPEDGAINHDHYLYGTPKKWVKREGQWVEASPLPDDFYTHSADAKGLDSKSQEKA